MENQDMKLMKRKRFKVGLVRTLLSPEIGSLIVGIAIVIIVTSINKNFISARNLVTMLSNASFIGIVAIGQALIIMSGEMDLSVGSNGAFGSVLFGMMAVWYNVPWGIALVVSLAFSCAIGWVNGFLMLKIGVMKWVATLATSNLCVGLANYFSEGVPIGYLPKDILRFGDIGIQIEGVGRLSGMFFIFIGLIVIAELVIRYSKYGRMIQACGINSEAASMAGVNVIRTKWVTLIFVAILSYLGTSLANWRNGAIAPGGLAGIDFKSVASCYIGGIGFVGSTGSLLGLFLGVILIQLIENATSALAWDANVQLLTVGILVMFVLLLDVFKRRFMASRIDLV